MRITKISIPKSEENEEDGIEKIEMDKLGSIVLLAGKNGSGKTRILNKIASVFSRKPTSSQLSQSRTSKEYNSQNLVTYEQRLISLNKSLVDNPSLLVDVNGSPNFTVKQISEYTTAIRNVKNEIFRLDRILTWNLIETSELSETYSFIQFVPKSLSLTDPNTYSKQKLLESATYTDKVGTNLSGSVLSKIQVIQDRWFSSTHPSSMASETERAKAVNDYEKLRLILFTFLNTDIGRNIDDEATLFELPIGKANLSDGQRIIIQFCVALYSQEVAIKDLVLVLDEPENHLHPSVIIDVIERIQKCLETGQIWIATHSIPLLSHFDPAFIWYVENGTIHHAGKIPEKVLQSLLGDESQIAKLQDFISLPAQFATSRYAFESLFEPAAVLTGTNDPQIRQIKSELMRLSSTGKLRVLDYGAGKGRLISNIVDLDESSQEKLVNSIDYIAYDKFSEDKYVCETALTKAYGDCDKRYFNDLNQLFGVYDKKSFQVVIMCNVLHEIDPKDWLKLFNKEGLISSMLSENGILLLVEDQQIPIGEKAYQKGFLVLDTPQLKDLFKITERDAGFKISDSRGDGRLKAYQIPKGCLIRIDKESRLAAIKSMGQTAREKILEIREKPKNYSNGKLHGFWVQQFANAQLNLDELTSD